MAEIPIEDLMVSDLCMNQVLFVAAYFRNNFNQRKAYKEIYGEHLSNDQADSCASTLINTPRIAAIVRKKKEELVETAMVDARWALHKRVQIIERCMQAMPVLKYDKELGQYIETGEYTFDSSGANSALNSVEKVHLGMAENKNITTKSTIEISSAKSTLLRGLIQDSATE
jgi:phage terminase small subunit